MARRRLVEAESQDGVPILPRHLVAYDTNAGDYRAFWTERRAWMKGHGIDPADWHRLQAILRASEKAHGLPDTSSLARARFAQAATQDPSINRYATDQRKRT